MERLREGSGTIDRARRQRDDGGRTEMREKEGGGWEHRDGGREADVRDREIEQEIQTRAEDQRVRQMGTKRAQKLDK